MTTIKINNWVKTDENDFTSTSVIKLESFNYKGELISGIKVEDKVIKGQFKKFIRDARDGIFKIKIEEKGLVENSYTPKVNSIKMPFNVSQLGDYNAYLEKGKLVIGSDGGSAIPKLKVVDENPEFPHPDKKQAASQGNDRQRVRKAITQAGEAKKKLFVFGYGNKSKEDFEDAVQALNDLIKIAKDGSSTNQSSPDQGKPGNDSGNNKKRKNENEDNNHSREPKRTKIEEEIKQNQAKSDEKNSNKLVNDLTNFNSKNEAEKKQSLADIERLKNQGGVYESQKEQVKEKKDEAAKSDPQGYGKMIAQIIRQKINEFKVEITKLGEKINTKLAQLENGEVTSDTEVRSIEEEISEEVSQEVANVETNNLLTQAQNLLKGASTYQSKKKEIEQTLSKLEIVSQNTNQSTKSSPFRSEVIIPVGLGLLMITVVMTALIIRNKQEKDLTTYLKHCGFILPNAEIYGGLANSPYNIGCDSQIITHPQVLEASEEYIRFLEKKDQDNYLVSDNCLKCGKNKFCSPRQFNLLLTTNLEITEGKENIVYLRPETCQGIFVNFPSIQRSTHRPLPFGIGQMGKSFRNEITLHHGIFRTREFEQMELEFFCQSEEIDLKNEELPHYAKKTQDLYFQYHFGWGELCSNSHRGNYDLSQHRQHSGKDFRINGIIPEVVESSFGVERLMLAILEDSYQKETIKNAQGEESEREVLKLSPLLAPYLVAVIPLEKSLREKSHQLYCELLKNPLFSVAYEETGNIGNRYRRQDAIGTYYCLTLDKQTLQDNTNTDDNLSPNKKKEPGSDALIYLLLFMLVALLVGELDKFSVSPTADEVIKLIQGNRNRRKTAKRILAGEMRGRTLTNQEKKEVEKELAMINEKWAENLQGFNMKEIEKENPTVLAKIYAGLYEQAEQELIGNEPGKYPRLTEFVVPQKDGTSKTIDYSQTLKIKFNGYSGFLTEKEKKNSSEGKEVFGLTTSDGVSFVSDQNHKVKLEKDTTNPVEGSIIPSEYYLVKTIGDNCGRTYHDICFEECLETMAHELAHAIVGNIKGEYEGEEGGGHGQLFYEIMKKIETMIKNSPDFSDFKTW
ncbi:2442_t:CDS:10 [Funneliformis geosporum]|nr:2442_t:CDS:10 [Funneliformis geosporum]